MTVPSNFSTLNNQYINLLDQEIFTIIVGTKNYTCNKYGINSSEVLRDYREKNPNAKFYVYNFGGPHDNFQLICDFFNFRKIKITSNNMNSLRTIAENLKINSVLTDVTNYINSYEYIVQKTDPIKEVFYFLYHIKEISVDSVKNSILNSIWVKSEDSIKELASFILQVVRSSYSLQTYLIDLIISLDEIPNQTDHLKSLKPFIINHIFTTFFTNQFYCCFAYKLCKKEIISIQNIIKVIIYLDNFFFQSQNQQNQLDQNQQNKIQNQNTNQQKKLDILNDIDLRQYKFAKFEISHHENIIIWFLPELFEFDDQYEITYILQSISPKTSSFILDYWPDKIENYKKIRDTCELEDDLIKSIINDDVDTLQSIISKSNYNINSLQVPFNLFEPFKDTASLLNYSAEYGSIKCFKYLMLNHAKTNISTLGYSIYGGNTEIIRIVDQTLNKKANYYNSNSSRSTQWGYSSNETSFNLCFDNTSLSNPIYITIMMHQNDLFDWIIEQKIDQNNISKQFLFDLANISVISGNIHSFIYCVDNGIDFPINYKSKFIDFLNISAKFGYFRLTEIILSLFNDNKLISEIGESSISFGNVEILKLFCDMKNFSFNFDNLLTTSFQYHFDDISSYIIENYYKPKTRISVIDTISYTIIQNSSKSFNLLESKFNFESLMNEFELSSNNFINFLNIACINKKYEISCKLIDFILKNFPITDFTVPFIEACCAGNEQIFQYFIDHKVKLNFHEVMKYAHNILNGNWKIAIKILDLIDSEKKESLSRLFFISSYNFKNKEAFEILLPQNINYKNALIMAVNFNDIKLVNLVLEHNSKPSFINHIYETGTAFNSAVLFNNIEIVKRFLSIPGINPSLSCAIINSICNLNVEITNLILDFYKNNLESIHDQIIIGLNQLQLKCHQFEGQFSESEEEKLILMINKLFSISKSISICYFDFLITAVRNNSIKLVSDPLKFEEINVNWHEYQSGDTPLIKAIKNKNIQIAQMLINYPKTNINASNSLNHTALTVAVENNLEDIVKSLLNHPNFDPDESNLNYSFLICSDDQKMLNCFNSNENLDVNYLIDHSIYVDL